MLVRTASEFVFVPGRPAVPGTPATRTCPQGPSNCYENCPPNFPGCTSCQSIGGSGGNSNIRPPPGDNSGGGGQPGDGSSPCYPVLTCICTQYGPPRSGGATEGGGAVGAPTCLNAVCTYTCR